LDRTNETLDDSKKEVLESMAESKEARLFQNNDPPYACRHHNLGKIESEYSYEGPKG
jgi:hypothetical protein